MDASLKILQDHLQHELVALLKASFNSILSEVSRYVALIIHIVDLV